MIHDPETAQLRPSSRAKESTLILPLRRLIAVMRMVILVRGFVAIAIPFALATNLSFDGKYHKGQCYTRILAFTSEGSLPLDDEVFARDAAGQPMSSPENLSLTLTGCNKLCGAKQNWYPDIGPRLSAWLIPVLLLIINVELSPLDKRRFFAIIHLLGDPIDSMWSLVHKLDSWDRCYDMAERYEGICEPCKRVVATVFAGFEELEGPLFRSDTRYTALVDKRDLIVHLEVWRRTAIKLADSRTDEFFRTCLAILLYLFQLIALFVKEVGGGSTSPPGGRIATGVFLSWLIPTILLSNAIGNFPSRRTCFDILSNFGEHTGIPIHVLDPEYDVSSAIAPLGVIQRGNYFQSLGWSGGIHSFRPWKSRHTSLERRQSRAVVVLLLAVLPMFVSMTGAFFILWVGLPIGLNCRHTWVIGIFLAWFLSAFITWLSDSPKFMTGKYHWHFVLLKDTMIAVPSVVIIFLSACGLFNSCYCWSGSFYYRERATLLMVTDDFWEAKGRSTFPLVVGVCVALQLAIFGATAKYLRRGLKLFRWSESLRSEEWNRGVGHEGCTCMVETEAEQQKLESP